MERPIIRHGPSASPTVTHLACASFLVCKRRRTLDGIVSWCASADESNQVQCVTVGDADGQSRVMYPFISSHFQDMYSGAVLGRSR